MRVLTLFGKTKDGRGYSSGLLIYMHLTHGLNIYWTGEFLYHVSPHAFPGAIINWQLPPWPTPIQHVQGINGLREVLGMLASSVKSGNWGWGGTVVVFLQSSETIEGEMSPTPDTKRTGDFLFPLFYLWHLGLGNT